MEFVIDGRFGDGFERETWNEVGGVSVSSHAV
jgi:hypothetical protein